MEEEKPQGLTQQQATLILIAAVIILGVIVWFVFRYLDHAEKSQQLTMDELTELSSGMSYTYDDYTYHMNRFKTEKIAGGRYSYFIEEEDQLIDSEYESEYNGYLFNKDLNYAIHKLQDGHYLLLYHPDSKVVYHSTTLPHTLSKADLLIYEKKGEKAEKIKEATKEKNQKDREVLIREIDALNVELTDLNQKILE